MSNQSGQRTIEVEFSVQIRFWKVQKTERPRELFVTSGETKVPVKKFVGFLRHVLYDWDETSDQNKGETSNKKLQRISFTLHAVMKISFMALKMFESSETQANATKSFEVLTEKFSFQKKNQHFVLRQPSASVAHVRVWRVLVSRKTSQQAQKNIRAWVRVGKNES